MQDHADERDAHEAMLESLFGDYPRALEPVTGWHPTDNALLLFSGQCAVEVKGELQEGQGTATLQWLPTPRVELRVELPPLPGDLSADDIPSVPLNTSTRFRVGEHEGEGRLARRNGYGLSEDGSRFVTLEVRAFALGRGLASEVRLDLVNMETLLGEPTTNGTGISNTRVRLGGTKWDVLLDARNEFVDHRREANPDGGYLVTHTARLTKVDQSEMSISEARNAVTLLQFALSIPQARWVTPVAVEGRRSDGVTAWRLWDLWNTEEHRRPHCWLPSLYATECQQEFFARLEARWQESRDTERMLRTASHYYLDSNRSRLVNSSIIVGLALLELAAWELVPDRGDEDALAKFDRSKLAKKLRSLLLKYQVPLTVPERAPALKALASREWNGDVATAISEVRHAAVHARRHREGWTWPLEAWGEALHVAHWYTDLALLALVGYRGRYLNRVTASTAADWEWVPWIETAEAATRRG